MGWGSFAEESRKWWQQPGMKWLTRPRRTTRLSTGRLPPFSLSLSLGPLACMGGLPICLALGTWLLGGRKRIRGQTTGDSLAISPFTLTQHAEASKTATRNDVGPAAQGQQGSEAGCARQKDDCRTTPQEQPALVDALARHRTQAQLYEGLIELTALTHARLHEAFPGEGRPAELAARRGAEQLVPRRFALATRPP
jgi:hypothetical protein